MNMIPGLGGDFLGKAGEEASAERLKMSMVIMESMSDNELDGKDSVKMFNKQPSRIMRVARGAGVRPAEVEGLLNQYKQFSSMMTSKGGLQKLLKGNGDKVSPQ
jgi:signal recognition particle subunit SRP54